MRQAQALKLTRYTRCGHIGRDNASYRAKHRTFIRVAEIRGCEVETVDKNCPDCKSD